VRYAVLEGIFCASGGCALMSSGGVRAEVEVAAESGVEYVRRARKRKGAGRCVATRGKSALCRLLRVRVAERGGVCCGCGEQEGVRTEEEGALGRG